VVGSGLRRSPPGSGDERELLSASLEISNLFGLLVGTLEFFLLLALTAKG
jgi:hypothetical protein